MAYGGSFFVVVSRFVKSLDMIAGGKQAPPAEN
jgi:hypothetical protein